MDLNELNAIPYETPSFQMEMNEWCRLASNQVRRRHNNTKHGRVKHSRKDCKPVLPVEDFCYHTGVRFADAEEENVNPNHPRKRSLDHKVPLIVCYIQGWTMDEANHPDNLCWCLRVVNNVRSSTYLTSFKPIADFYRNKFIAEGVEVSC